MREKLPDFHDGVNAVLRHFKVVRVVQNPLVFKRCNHPAGNRALRLWRVPGNTEHRDAESREAAGNFFELHDGAMKSNVPSNRRALDNLRKARCSRARPRWLGG